MHEPLPDDRRLAGPAQVPAHDDQAWAPPGSVPQQAAVPYPVARPAPPAGYPYLPPPPLPPVLPRGAW